MFDKLVPRAIFAHAPAQPLNSTQIRNRSKAKSGGTKPFIFKISEGTPGLGQLVTQWVISRESYLKDFSSTNPNDSNFRVVSRKASPVECGGIISLTDILKGYFCRNKQEIFQVK
jgi:hypothetical protein